jgi:hypothetical protein
MMRHVLASIVTAAAARRNCTAHASFVGTCGSVFTDDNVATV